jgi:hypothetical protein
VFKVAESFTIGAEVGATPADLYLKLELKAAFMFSAVPVNEIRVKLSKVFEPEMYP